MPARSVSQILSEDHQLNIPPGAKGECPFCHRATFAVKGDDSLGKCFHPSCGRYLTVGSDGEAYRTGISRVLEAVYKDFRNELLALEKGHKNAYTYLRDERGIHPQVIADSLLG